jgi:hypothetical protein
MFLPQIVFLSCPRLRRVGFWRTEQDLIAAQSNLDFGVAEVALLKSGDQYYYNHHQDREFPVYRVIYGNGDRYYISASSGALLRFADSNAQTYRWVFNALHVGDYWSWYRHLARIPANSRITPQRRPSFGTLPSFRSIAVLPADR